LAAGTHVLSRELNDFAVAWSVAHTLDSRASFRIITRSFLVGLASMKVFHCDHCQQLVFFENVSCVKCGHTLAYLPDVVDIASLEPAEDNIWRTFVGKAYRLCDNYSKEKVCNWAVPAETSEVLCESCRLSCVIPDLGVIGNREKWYRLEVAKRRLIYSLRRLKLPFANTAGCVSGLRFEFLADSPEADGGKVLTGHSNGRITINVAEADDAEREQRRLAMHEPYRTLLGHFRHEIGHYYWDRLIDGSDLIEPFRELFGDERQDYAQALKSHYDQGPPADWQMQYVSAYAGTHPWEDWAETWAHYLHITDALETAAASGLWLRPGRRDEPALRPSAGLREGCPASFDQLMENWFPLTYLVNNLNRGLGMRDGYPFVLSPTAIAKLRFVHDTIGAIDNRGSESAQSPDSEAQCTSVSFSREPSTRLWGIAGMQGAW